MTAALGLLLPRATRGQEPSATPPPEREAEVEAAPGAAEPPPEFVGPPAEPPAPPVPPPAVPEAEKPPPCTAEEPCLQAKTQEFGAACTKAAGFVDLQFGESRIQADQLDICTRDKPGGGTYQEIVASGNVVFLRGSERLSGEALTMNLSTGEGAFENAVGYLSPGVFVEARRIERRDAETYRIEGGKFTSCAQPTPRWSFQASSATLKVDDRIVARNVLFKVKQVPAFYIPLFAYPIQEDQRSSGLLFPTFGQSSQKGFEIGTGFFWAMSRSFDQTFYLNRYSQFGWGVGHEFRYALRQPSRGTLTSYFFRRQEGAWEYDLNWNARQQLPGRVEATLNARAASNLVFQGQIHNDLDAAFNRQRTFSLNLQRTFGRTTARLFADSQETFFGDNPDPARRVHLPGLRLKMTPVKEPRTGLVFQYEASAENLGRDRRGEFDSYARFDLAPRLSRSFSTPFLQATPSFALRYTRYGARLEEPGGALEAAPLHRRYGEARVEVVGPTLSRVFVTPGNFYSERFKHVIGPEVTWTYRSRVDDLDRIPTFDGHDNVAGTHEVRYALVQRLYAKRPGASGKLEPYEFLTWHVSQAYYVQIADDQNERDPNFSTGLFGPGGAPDHNSPIRSRLTLRPAPRLSSSFNLEYDVNFSRVRTLSVDASADYPHFGLQAVWSRGNRVARVAENWRLDRDTVRGSLRLGLVPGKLALQGSGTYDLLNQNLQQAAGRLRYDVQCCGFSVEVIKSHFNVVREDDLEFRFSVELANVGSIGNFLGQGGQRR